MIPCPTCADLRRKIEIAQARGFEDRRQQLQQQYDQHRAAVHVERLAFCLFGKKVTVGQ